MIYEEGGGKYEGEIRDGKKHGVGVYVSQNGETYEGYWENSQKTGFGKYTYSNGDTYTGNFSQNRPNGHGKMDYYLSGNIYEGQWRDGKASGQGILNLTRSSEHRVLKGEFWDCELHGFGQLISSTIKYIGEFRNGE